MKKRIIALPAVVLAGAGAFIGINAATGSPAEPEVIKQAPPSYPSADENVTTRLADGTEVTMRYGDIQAEEVRLGKESPAAPGYRNLYGIGRSGKVAVIAVCRNVTKEEQDRNVTNCELTPEAIGYEG